MAVLLKYYKPLLALLLLAAVYASVRYGYRQHTQRRLLQHELHTVQQQLQHLQADRARLAAAQQQLQSELHRARQQADEQRAALEHALRQNPAWRDQPLPESVRKALP